MHAQPHWCRTAQRRHFGVDNRRLQSRIPGPTSLKLGPELLLYISDFVEGVVRYIPCFGRAIFVLFQATTRTV
jgi:hypothetical protein